MHTEKRFVWLRVTVRAHGSGLSVEHASTVGELKRFLFSVVQYFTFVNMPSLTLTMPSLPETCCFLRPKFTLLEGCGWGMGGVTNLVGGK